MKTKLTPLEQFLKTYTYYIKKLLWLNVDPFLTEKHNQFLSRQESHKTDKFANVFNRLEFDKQQRIQKEAAAAATGTGTGTNAPGPGDSTKTSSMKKPKVVGLQVPLTKDRKSQFKLTFNNPYESRVGSMLSQKITDENGSSPRDE